MMFGRNARKQRQEQQKEDELENKYHQNMTTIKDSLSQNEDIINHDINDFRENTSYTHPYSPGTVDTQNTSARMKYNHNSVHFTQNMSKETQKIADQAIDSVKGVMPKPGQSAMSVLESTMNDAIQNPKSIAKFFRRGTHFRELSKELSIANEITIGNRGYLNDLAKRFYKPTYKKYDNELTEASYKLAHAQARGESLPSNEIKQLHKKQSTCLRQIKNLQNRCRAPEGGPGGQQGPALKRDAELWHVIQHNFSIKYGTNNNPHHSYNYHESRGLEIVRWRYTLAKKLSTDKDFSYDRYTRPLNKVRTISQELARSSFEHADNILYKSRTQHNVDVQTTKQLHKDRVQSSVKGNVNQLEHPKNGQERAQNAVNDNVYKLEHPEEAHLEDHKDQIAKRAFHKQKIANEKHDAEKIEATNYAKIQKLQKQVKQLKRQQKTPVNHINPALRTPKALTQQPSDLTKVPRKVPLAQLLEKHHTKYMKDFVRAFRKLDSQAFEAQQFLASNHSNNMDKALIYDITENPHITNTSLSDANNIRKNLAMLRVLNPKSLKPLKLHKNVNKAVNNAKKMAKQHQHGKSKAIQKSSEKYTKMLKNANQKNNSVKKQQASDSKQRSAKRKQLQKKTKKTIRRAKPNKHRPIRNSGITHE